MMLSRILILFILFILSPLTGALAQQDVSRSLYDKLVEVNVKWAEQSDIPPILTVLPELNNETSMLQAHLMLVENILRKRTPTEMSPVQLMNRESALDELNKYWKSAAFPLNTSHNYRLPIFIDQEDNFCAVGHLLKVSGFESVAREISEQTNYAYVQDMSYQALPVWANRMGLTVDELAWIQPGYPPPTFFDSLKGGTNGVVNAIAADESAGILYAAGSFSEADGMTGYNNIAQWISGIAGYDWLTLDNGLNGEVKAMLHYNDQLFVGGEFSQANGNPANNIAIWDGVNWINAGSLNGRVNSFKVYNGEVYVSGLFDNSPDFKNIAKWDGTDWVSIGGSTDGEVLILETYDGSLILGGTFTSAGSATVSNIASFNSGTFSNLDIGIPATVRALAVFQNQLYSGGDYVNGIDTFALARYVSGSWENLAMHIGVYDSSSRINSLLALADKIVLGGDFIFYPFVGYFGDGLVSFNGSWADGVGVMDSTVNTLFESNNTVYIGGQFTTATSSPAKSITFANLGPTGIKNQITQDRFELYPNPSNRTVNIRMGEARIESIHIYDTAGRAILRYDKLSTDFSSFPVHMLSSGVYFIRVITTDQEVLTDKLLID